MERIAVISDLHANLEALRAVLGRTADTPVYCLGDLVDYGANPNEVVDLVRDRQIKVIKGNHDEAAVTGDTSQFNAKAAMGSKWTSATLTDSNRKFLKELPLSLRFKIGGTSVSFFHGSPDDPLWEYVDPLTHSLLFSHYLDKLGVGLIGLGHTHVPYSISESKGRVFNPGSVGQPRDGDPRASYAEVQFDGDTSKVEIIRVSYDNEAAARKILAAGLPEVFASRLHTGT